MAASAASPAGTPMQSWLEKWSEWEIQAVVLVSFSAQVILFFFAGIRRYSVSSVLRVLLWLVYLTADGAAIYALGHMSASLSKTSTDKHQLVAFWAPFLLLHLGGQDTITAYALEDNELWLRHLLTMSVQVAGTGYVLHKYIIADRATVVSAAVLVSVAGFVKYGERIRALKCASKGSYRSYRYYFKKEELNKAKKCFARNEKFRTYEVSVRTAHEYLYVIAEHLIRDLDVDIYGTRSIVHDITHNVDGLPRGDVSARENLIKEVYRVIEVQLALMYDMLYTKTQVIHSRNGYLIRVINFGFCFCALVAFAKSKRDRYSTPDIVITFVLLGGACALELASAFKVIGSTWTYPMLRRYGWDWLLTVILFARYHLIVIKDGRWSNSVGRYDFISFCGSDRTELKRRIAGWIGLEDWWNKAHYTKHAKLSPAQKEFVWSLLKGEKSGMVEIEDVAIQSGGWARRLTGFNQSEKLDWSLRMEFRNCVFIWHIATSTFLSHPTVKSELVVTFNTGMAEAVNTLSDYMMYLLVQHPDIMPINAAARSLFQQTYACYVQSGNSIFNFHEDRNVDKHQKKMSDLEKQYGDRLQYLTSDNCNVGPGDAVLAKASILVRTLVDVKLELTHKLVIIGRVWTEMLCYAATNASGGFHARQLGNGGEFVTHILFLAAYCSAVIWREGRIAARDQDVEVAVPVESGAEVCGDVKLNVDTDSEEEIIESR